MSTKKHLMIGEVVGRTGITERALRYYEDRGLLQPVRTDSGRRTYAAADLTRIHHITQLKKASFSLAQIKRLLDDSDFDFGALIDIQIECLEAELAAADTALTVLRTTKSILDGGEELDLEALCELIRLGERKMQNDAWQKVFDKYYTPEEQERWKTAKAKLSDSFDQDDYERQWRDLSDRMEQALPLDPASAAAQAFVLEWNALLAPFLSVADDTVVSGASRLWSNMEDWSGQVESPISKDVIRFIHSAQQGSH